MLSADVLVVGAGPAGLHAARRLAEQGNSVLVLEEHPVIGEPVDCSGVVGTESFAEFGLPPDAVLGKVGGLRLISPGGIPISYHNGKPLAFLTERNKFDQVLARIAEASGARIVTGVKVMDLNVRPDCVEMRVRRTGEVDETDGRSAEGYRARAAVIAVGPRYSVQRFFGMGQPSHVLKTAHAEIAGNGFREATVFFGTGAGKFSWVLPFTRGNEKFLRVGTAGGETPGKELKALLRERMPGQFKDLGPSVRHWIIPLNPIRRTYTERLVVVGDAAGQVKPSSGGGIYYGMLCAELAAEVLTEGLRRDDLSRNFLFRYEKAWKGRIGAEIRAGRLFRFFFERMTAEEIDLVFHVLSSDSVLKEVADEVRFDWHRGIIMAMLRHPRLSGLLLRKALSRG